MASRHQYTGAGEKCTGDYEKFGRGHKKWATTATHSRITYATQVTKEFKGGDVLLKLLRAIPELQPIRLNSHNDTSSMLAKRMLNSRSDKLEKQLEIRAPIWVEMAYSVVEMLFGTNFANQKVVIERLGAAIEALFADIWDQL